MTYCVGWRTEGTVFLMADSAVTSSIPIEENHAITSFGETHDYVGAESVQETAVKVIPIMNTIFTFAGVSTLGYSIAETLNLALEHGESPQVALQAAVRSNLSAASNNSVQVLYGYYFSEN